MNMGEKEKYEMDHKNEDQMNYSPGISSDWRFDGSNLTNSSMGLVHPGNSVASSSCSSAPMADSMVSTLWDRSATSQNMGFGERALELCWNPGGSNPMLKGGLFLPNLPGGPIPPSLSQLPADSAFIERAARFSSFNAGNFGDIIVNPFPGPHGMGLYTRTGGQEAFFGNGMRRIEPNNATEASKDTSKKGLEKIHDEKKQVVSESGNESDEAEFSSGVGVDRDEASALECAGGEASGKVTGPRKRKRNVQDSDDQGKGVSNQTGDDTELQHKVDQSPSTTVTYKASAKNGKQGSQASDPTKEDYIHVRARRGQATNSHSLAERVRREKISERMKFLQDLVPGCSKVTGKAVMLDEIINYVQSLQRQVEFLSMKLATVNPRLDFNLEGLIAKDMLQPRLVGSSSSLVFAPDMHMAYQTLQAPPQGLVQPSLLGMGSASDILRRTISSHLTPMPGGFKEPSQFPNAWDDELNNVVQMSFGTRNSPSSQDAEGSVPSGQMKVEL